MTPFRPLVWCGLLMIVVTLATSILAFEGWLKKELFFSWFLNLFNAYLFAAVSRKAVGRESHVFLAWALLGHGIRFLIVLAAVSVAILADWGHSTALIAFILTGFLIFIAGEVSMLTRLSK